MHILYTAKAFLCPSLRSHPMPLLALCLCGNYIAGFARSHIPNLPFPSLSPPSLHNHSQ